VKKTEIICWATSRQLRIFPATLIRVGSETNYPRRDLGVYIDKEIVGDVDPRYTPVHHRLHHQHIPTLTTCLEHEVSLRDYINFQGHDTLQAGAPTQIQKWGDNYGERSEPKNFFARGEIIPPETTKLAIFSYEQTYNIYIF
jgi:hypothetical protein